MRGYNVIYNKEVIKMIVVYMLLLIAVGMDLRSMRISNRLILVGLLLSFIQRVFCNGMGGFLTGIVLISLPVILLYLLFLVGALGAGDIKLFSLIGGFIQLKELMWCIIFAFLFGAIFSLMKMLYLGTFLRSMGHVSRYVRDIFQGERQVYQPESLEDGRIHFSIAILCGFILTDIYFIS